MTEKIEFFKISRDLKVLWTVEKVFSTYFGGNRRWVPLMILQLVISEP